MSAHQPRSIRAPNGQTISIGSPDYMNYVAQGFFSINKKMVKGVILNGKVLVQVPGTHSYVMEGSIAFQKLNKRLAYDSRKKRFLDNNKLQSGFVYDPQSGKPIKIGDKEYRELHGKGFIYRKESNVFEKVTTKTDYIINPRTNRFIRRGSKVFENLMTDPNYVFSEKYKAFIPVHENMLLRLVGSGIFKKIEKRFMLKPKVKTGDLSSFIAETNPLLEKAIDKTFEEMGSFKIVLSVDSTMTKDGKNLTKIQTTSSKDADAVPILRREDIGKAITSEFAKIANNIDKFQQRGSQWRVVSINKMFLHIFRYSPLRGSSYITLPKSVAAKKACVNIKNIDNRCFEYSVLCSLYYDEIDDHHHRATKYSKYKGQLKFDGIEFPVKDSSYSRFEKLNNIKLNVFILKEGGNDSNEPDISPLYVSREKFEREVDLLLITEGEIRHYVCIRNFSRMFSTVTGHKETKFFCKNCLQHFTKPELVLEHQEHGKCFTHDPAKLILPPKGENYVKFKNIKHQLKSPVIVYCDFECFLRSEDKQMGEKTKLFQRHEANSVGAYVVSSYTEFNRGYVQFDGPDCAKELLHYLQQLEKDIFEVIKNPVKLVMTKYDKNEFRKATSCHICEKPFGKSACSYDRDSKMGESEETIDYKSKVRDHDHFTGMFRGAAHHGCNLNYGFRGYKIPVVFHNFRGYDSHLLMTALGTCKNISVIANNNEKFMSLSVGKLRFIDSMQFMPCSLAELAKNLKNFNHVAKGFPSVNDGNIKLLTSKGIYPYEYMSSADRFNETTLPPKEAFHSRLVGSDISDEDYEHAQNVWRTFNCKILKDYHDLYLKTDILLLADVFENFRETCYNYYGLDAAHYMTAPGLSWDAMLKLTGVTLETFHEGDVEKLLFIENAKRGGVSVITHRHAVANNKYMKSYYPNKETSYIIYLDANNLYGWAMLQCLPIGGYNWEDPAKFTSEYIKKMSPNQQKGFWFEVDIQYPHELHDLHNDYPFCPELATCTPSSHMSKIKAQLGIKFASTQKLVQRLTDKKRYVMHYLNLKQSLENGIVLEKVHRVLSFEQSNWLAEYIDFNTKKRAEATNDFEKDFFKLMNNSIFGKTCENLRNRVDIRLVSNEKKAQKLQNLPYFKDSRVISDELRAIEMRKTEIYYNRPVIVGACILDLSKTLMYDFHYKVIKEKYGNNAKLLFTDTDSLCYHIKTDDIYEDMKQQSDLYDFSDYDKAHPCYSASNKKVIGKMKDEMAGKIMTEFIGIRAKNYCYVLDDGKEGKRAKGIKKACVKSDLNADDYRNCVLGGVVKSVNFNLIRSKNHKLGTITVSKTALCPYDDKRWICDDGINTLAHGHVLLNENKQLFVESGNGSEFSRCL